MVAKLFFPYRFYHPEKRGCLNLQKGATLLGSTNLEDKSKGTAEDAAIVVPEKDAAYPTSGMFGDVLPASAFFVRHVKNITFDNVRLVMKNENVLPAFVLDDVKGISIRYPQLHTLSKIELVNKKDCENVQIF